MPEEPEIYLGAQPSKGRIKRLYGKVREHLSSANTDPLEDVVAALNRMLVGWAQYSNKFQVRARLPEQSLRGPTLECPR